MTTLKTIELKARLREAIRTMDSQQAQEIREAYFKVDEGLRSRGGRHSCGRDERPRHLKTCMAIYAMKNSLLGRIL